MTRKTRPQAAGASDALPALFEQALQLQKAGVLTEAEKLYRKILAIDPRHAHTLHMLGIIAFDTSCYGAAEELVRRALIERSDVPMFYYTMGRILSALERPREAIEHYKQALSMKPEFVDCLNSLGDILRAEGKLDDAMQCYLQAISIRPDANIYLDIGLTLQNKGLHDEAGAYYSLALERAPDFPLALNNLGVICNELGQYEDAIFYYKKSLAIEPDKPETLGNLATTFKNLGRTDEAIACFRQALALAPDHAAIYSNILLTMVYASSVSPTELAATARDFGRRIADPLRRQRPFTRDNNPERKLRIGYVSPDFREHAVNYFFAPLLKGHNREQFEIFAYSNAHMEDSVTEQIKQGVDHWRDIRFLNDDAAADLIDKDKIDILVDVAGHTARNRLMIFARKPAPVQVTWLGYPATTGMKAMDYRITDNYAEPPGMTEQLNTETLWRLPEIFCCYQAHEKSPAVIDHPPFEDNGYITFGCFNNFTKVSDQTLTTWAQIMAQVPNSHLLLEIGGIENPKSLADVRERLMRIGLPLERIMLEPRKRSNQFVLYNRIDIALDPFPCVGGTTTFDTLWMGVPLVTLAGEHFVSRMGITILSNAGLPEFIANNTNEYIAFAADLANNRERLKKLRHNLRDKIYASPLMNAQNFVHNMEESYRGMWRKYCVSKP